MSYSNDNKIDVDSSDQYFIFKYGQVSEKVRTLKVQLKSSEMELENIRQELIKKNLVPK